jgi:hypothetical protein
MSGQLTEQVMPTGVTGFGGQRFQVSDVASRPGWRRMMHPECGAEVIYAGDHNTTLYSDLHDCDARGWGLRSVPTQ